PRPEPRSREALLLPPNRHHRQAGRAESSRSRRDPGSAHRCPEAVQGDRRRTHGAAVHHRQVSRAQEEDRALRKGSDAGAEIGPRWITTYTAEIAEHAEILKGFSANSSVSAMVVRRSRFFTLHLVCSAG